MTDPHRENRRLWNEWSDAFQALWNADTDDGGLPPVPCPFADGDDGWGHPDLLPSIEGAEVVELGCGGGQGSVGTALAGADRVVGVDVSERQLRHARRLRSLYGVDIGLLQADVTRVPFPTDAFDVAFSEWAFQMVDDLDAALEEARRVLRPDGAFLLSVPHPFHELFDPETGEFERGYFDGPERRVEIDESYDAEMVVFDRSMSDLHGALRDAGFEVVRTFEPEPNPGTADAAIDEYVPRTLRFLTRPA